MGRRTRRHGKSRVTRKKKRGGVKLGEGKDGAVYSPALPCEITFKSAGTEQRMTINPDDYVVKKFKEGKRVINQDVLARLQEVDPEQKYFLYPIVCEKIVGELSAENIKDGLSEADLPNIYLVKKAKHSFAVEMKPLFDVMKQVVVIRRRSGYEKNPTLEGIVTDAADLMIKRVVPVAELVKKLHEAGIYHQDLGILGNIVVMEDGTPRLIDFDSARLFDKNSKMDFEDMIDSELGWEEYFDELKVDFPEQSKMIVSAIRKAAVRPEDLDDENEY
jgi:serine/threonine protein kinase